MGTVLLNLVDFEILLLDDEDPEHGDDAASDEASEAETTAVTGSDVRD